MKGRIFISYSHTDKEKVYNIIHALKDVTDMPVWYDDSLRCGDNFSGTIVVSENSIQSDWCMHEFEIAVPANKKNLALFIENVALPKSVSLTIFNTYYIQTVTLSDDELREILKKTLEFATSEKKKNLLSLSRM